MAWRAAAVAATSGGGNEVRKVAGHANGTAGWHHAICRKCDDNYGGELTWARAHWELACG